MRTIEGVVGNRRDDPTLEERLQAHDRAGSLERVVIEAAERKKSRLRVETDAGTDLGVVVEQPPLREGDVLFVDEAAAAVVTFERTEAYVIDLPEPTPETFAAVVELGHRIGNQHWDVAVEDGAVYVPVEADRHILEDVLESSIPDGVSTRYREVDASLFLEDGPNRQSQEHHTHSHHHSDGDHTHHHGDTDGHGATPDGDTETDG